MALAEEILRWPSIDCVMYVGGEGPACLSGCPTSLVPT